MNDLQRTVRSRGRGFLLRVETSHDAQDYQKYEDIRNEIWGFPDDHLAGTRNMMCENFLAEGGGFPLEGANLAGFCYGFAGVLDKNVGFRDPANLRFYSQFAGVRAKYQAYGLGILMKEFQRDVVLGRLGIGTIICTYDPLTGVNAHRNVHHFGMEVLEYRVATYGEYGGFLNRSDIASDRFLMSWDLRRRPAAPAPPPADAGRVLIVEDLRAKGGRSGPALEVVRGVDLDLDGQVLLVRIPSDFYGMLRDTDVADPDVRRIPADWRLHTRRAFLALFGRGYRVVDFLKMRGDPPSNYYVLARG